jgi:carbon storage regulator
MLVMRRKAGESVLIGTDVELEILEIGAGQVKLGIRAPREVRIRRREVQLTQFQNQIAARTDLKSALAHLKK